MSLSQAATEFLTSRPAGVSAVSRSAAGLLTSWVENGFNCSVQRDPAGLPYMLVAERAGRGLRLTQSFTYSGGVLVGMTGDTIPTVFRAEVMGGQAPVSGGGSLNRLSNVMARGIIGSLTAQASSGSTFTYHTTTTLEQNCTQFRVWLPNMDAAAALVSQCKVAVSNAIGADPTVGLSGEARYTPSTATWVQVTFGGQNAVTLPPALVTTASLQVPSWTASDWIDIQSLDRADGGTLPVIMMRALVTSGNKYTTTAYAIPEWQKLVSTINNGRLWNCYRFTGDGITTPTNFVLTTDLGAAVASFFTRFEYRGVGPGLTIAGSGDSLVDGAVNGSTGNYGNGWLWQLTNLLRAAYPGLPIELCLLSFSSTKSDSFPGRTENFAASGIHYDVLAYIPFSPNDGNPTAALITGQYKRYSQVTELIANARQITGPTAAVTVGASPFAYVAPAAGQVAIAGGTVSAVTLTRPGSTAVALPTAGLVNAVLGDIITVTYTVAPTMTFIPGPGSMQPGKPMIVLTPFPNTTAAFTSGQDALRLAMRTQMIASRTAGALVADVESALSDGAVPARYKASLTTDGTHPNEAGHAAVAAAALPWFRKVIPLAQS